MRGQLGSNVLQDAVEDGAGRGVGVVAWVRVGVLVGPVEDHVGVVGVLAAGHCDVEVLPCGGRFHQDVCGVDGDALRSVGGDRITQIDMIGHIRGREDDGAAEPAAGPADRDRPVVADAGDGPGVTVAYPVLPGS